VIVCFSQRNAQMDVLIRLRPTDVIWTELPKEYQENEFLSIFLRPVADTNGVVEIGGKHYG